MCVCSDLVFAGSHHKSPRGRRDNVETIDMEMSDDDFADFEDLAEGIFITIFLPNSIFIFIYFSFLYQN